MDPRAGQTLDEWCAEVQGKNWKNIAECVPGRKDKRKTDVQCQHRWLKVLNPNLTKGPWRKDEDDLLSELIKVFIENDKPKWSKIWSHWWHNHLNPTIKKLHGLEEELILVQAQRDQGNKCAEIAKLLPGRTENNIKNHLNFSVKRRLEHLVTSSPLSGYGPCGSESRVVNQSNMMPVSYKPFQIKEAANSPQRDSLELTPMPMNWRNLSSSTNSLKGDEEETISSSVESDWLRRNSEVEISQWTPSSEDHHHKNVWLTPQLTTPSSVEVPVSPETRKSSSNGQEVREGDHREMENGCEYFREHTFRYLKKKITSLTAQTRKQLTVSKRPSNSIVK